MEKKKAVKMSKQTINIVGAGLAGSEAAWQCAQAGFKVRLYEMRPTKSTPAHQSNNFAELVCSNSLRSNVLTNAVGLLKEEMRILNSLIIQQADKHAVPAGSALAVDRDGFSKGITQTLLNHPNIEVIYGEVTQILEGPTIIASGPLTSETLSLEILKFVGEEALYFYDAVAPIIEKDSIDFSKAFFKSRYDKGEPSYINCGMNQEQFDAFYQALLEAEEVVEKPFEKLKFFEGCMPVEAMAKRGKKTLTFGPLKPVGLNHNDQRFKAVVQLRQDDAAANLYNMVGFQTHLKFADQKRIIQMIPGLENANIVRYGVMHRNTYINAPLTLKETYQSKKRDDLFFAGQLMGVEGYVESAASGLYAALNMIRYLTNKPLIKPHPQTMMLAMAYYVSHANPKHFVVMNANFGLADRSDFDKDPDKNEKYAQRACELTKQLYESSKSA